MNWSYDEVSDINCDCNLSLLLLYHHYQYYNYYYYYHVKIAEELLQSEDWLDLELWDLKQARTPVVVL